MDAYEGVPFEEDEWPKYNQQPEEEIVHLGGIPEGYYLVPDAWGKTHKFRVVKTAFGPEAEKGTKTVGVLTNAGETPEKSIDAAYFAFIYEDGRVYAWEDTPVAVAMALEYLASAADPLEFGEEYAKKTGICWRCGKPLSRDASITRGMGPICWAKMGSDGD